MRTPQRLFSTFATAAVVIATVGVGGSDDPLAVGLEDMSLAPDEAIALHEAPAVIDPADPPDHLLDDAKADAAKADVPEVACEDDVTPPGYLSVNTVPWTRIIVDEKPQGSTPLFRRRLASGKRTVRFVNEAYGIDVTDEVDVESGRTLKLRLYLALDFARSADLSFSDFDDKAVQAACDDAAAGDPAFLSIRTEPWAKVYVDNRYLGHTPLFRAPISDGDHVLRLVRDDGHAPMNAFSRFSVEAGEVVKFDLRPQFPGTSL